VSDWLRGWLHELGFDLDEDPTAAAAHAAAVAMIALIANADGDRWNKGQEVEERWFAGDQCWALYVGRRRLTLDRDGRLHDVGDRRLRVIDETGVILDVHTPGPVIGPEEN
jgi:hypothetical protein